MLIFPDHVQHHVAESRIAIMPVSSPACRTDIHFDISGSHGTIPYLDNSCTKIRPAFQIVKTWMKNANRLSVQRFKLVPKQALVQPNCLKQAFGRGMLVFMEYRHNARLDAPASV